MLHGMLLRRALRGSAICVAALGGGTYVASTATPAESAHERKLFTFGVVADIQYCDCDDAPDFEGNEIRRYRPALSQARDAVRLWNSRAVAFVVQLGDIIDGQNAGKYGAGLGFSEPQSDAAFSRVAGELERCDAPIYHAVGNHELYNFDWADLLVRLHRPALGWYAAEIPPRSVGDVDGMDGAGAGAGGGIEGAESEARFYFSWRPRAGWTFIMLNSYHVSLDQVCNFT